MKAASVIITALLSCLLLQAQTDTARFSGLEARLEEYIRALEGEPSEIKNKEIDFIIGSCKDSLVRQFVALKLYSHYLESPIMGDDASAVHICDKWFIPGLIKMNSGIDLMNAKIFAEFNRESLVGMKAPQMTLYDKDMNPADIPDSGNGNGGNGKYKVLYFYDTGCAKCRLESLCLKTLFTENSYPADLYAIYTQDNREEWLDYIKDRLDFGQSGARVFNLWDPERESGFPKKYGILQTPRIFLLAPDWEIIGRGLDSEALKTMLDRIFSGKKLEYGSKESEEFYDNVFAQDPSCDEVIGIIDRIRDRTLSQNDLMLYRQMTGDLLYYLASKRGEALKCGMKHLVDSCILSRPDIWNTGDDSLQIVQFAAMMDELLEKSPIGSEIKDIEVLSSLRKPANGKIKIRDGIYRLGRLKGDRNIIIFHTEGCPACRSEIEAADSILLGREGRKTRVLLIDMDRIISSSSRSDMDILFGSFDLTTLPYITETDRKGTVKRKYVSLH